MADATVDFAVPTGLAGGGLVAARTIVNVLKEDGALYAGGCKVFYTPEEWRERGEKYGTASLLIVCHDGGGHAPYFNGEDVDGAYRLQERLKQAGLYVEQCTGWYSAVYRADDFPIAAKEKPMTEPKSIKQLATELRDRMAQGEDLDGPTLLMLNALIRSGLIARPTPGLECPHCKARGSFTYGATVEVTREVYGLKDGQLYVSQSFHEIDPADKEMDTARLLCGECYKEFPLPVPTEDIDFTYDNEDTARREAKLEE